MWVLRNTSSVSRAATRRWRTAERERCAGPPRNESLVPVGQRRVAARPTLHLSRGLSARAPRRWVAHGSDQPESPASEPSEGPPPGAVALEQVHSHVKHPRTAILMAHARGVTVLAAAQRNTPVVGYAATRIKKTLTGSGRRPQIAGPARDHGRARPRPAPRAQRRRRRLRRGPLPLPHQPEPAAVEGHVIPYGIRTRLCQSRPFGVES